MPSTPSPTGAEGKGSTAPECLQVHTQDKDNRGYRACFSGDPGSPTSFKAPAQPTPSAAVLFAAFR
jgi:hypothetical protein